MKTIECGIRFAVQYPPFPPELTCELERYHDGPHVAQGFAWGPLDQSKDFQVQMMREAYDERADRVRGWHMRKKR